MSEADDESRGVEAGFDIDMDKTVISDTINVRDLQSASSPGPNRVPVETSGPTPRYLEIDLPDGTPPRLGRYTLIRLLGRGGMAEVYLAKQDGPAGFEKTCVVKRIRPHFAVEKRFVDMFLREARVAARLNHANIVQIFELGQEGNEFFIAMEHLDGISLHRAARRCWANETSIPMEVALRSVADSAQGLAHAHDYCGPDGRPAPLIHRDISPDNLMLTKDGVTKVLDFGIAKTIDEVDEVTKTGEIKGKVPYMSPEQIRGDAIDGRSDLWSLGVTLYWLLTGRRPFDGGTDHMTIDRILRGEPAPPRDFNPLIPPAVQRIMLALLEKETSKRIQSGHELHDALIALLGPAAGTTPCATFTRRVLALPHTENQLQPGSVITVVAARPETQWLKRVSEEDATTLQALPAKAVGVKPPLGDPDTKETASGIMTVSTAVARKQLVLPVAASAAVAVAILVVGALVISGQDDAPVVAPPVDTPPPVVVQPPEPPPSDPAVPTTPPSENPAEAATTKTPPPEKEERPRDVRRAPPPPTTSISAKAPGSVRWKVGKKTVGSGSGSLKVPVGTTSLLAEDTTTGGRVTVPIHNGAVDYAALGTGKLDVRARPWAKVQIGSKNLGTTPFDPVSLPTGDYSVVLEWEGKKKTQKVSIGKGKMASIKIDMRAD